MEYEKCLMDKMLKYRHFPWVKVLDIKYIIII